MVRELSASNKGLPDIRGLDIPGLDSTKKFFNRSVDKVKDTVGDVLDKVTPEDVPVISRGVEFGQMGRRLIQDSPLGEFLGRPGLDPKGAPGAPDTYAFENTPEGIKFAADNGYESIDLDMLITKDGHMVATHYSQPMKKDGFYDPLKKIDESTKVSDMTLAEVMRLRNEDGQSQIYPMSRMIEELKKNGIAGDFEAKNDSRFTTDEVMGGFADMVRDSGIRANLKSIDRSSESREILEAAQRQGFWVRTAAGNDRPRRDFGYGD